MHVMPAAGKKRKTCEVAVKAAFWKRRQCTASTHVQCTSEPTMCQSLCEYDVCYWNGTVHSYCANDNGFVRQKRKKKKKKREVIRWINYVYVVICMEEFNSLASKGQIANTQNTQANKAGTTAGKLLSETTDIFHVSQHRWCFSHFRKCLKYHLQYGHGQTTSKKRKTINFMVMTMNQ